MFRRFIYFLTEPDGRSITVQNGVVTPTAQPTPLKNTPDGWQDISIGWERKLERMGVFRTFTLPLAFVREAALILRTYAYKYGSPLNLVITRLTTELITGTQYRQWYKLLYKGEIDYTTIKDEEYKVTVAATEGGVVKQINANENTVYEIPIDSDPEAVTVKMDGLYFVNTLRYFFIDGLEITDFPPDSYYDFAVPFSYTTQEGAAPYILHFDQQLEAVGNESSYITTSTNYHLQCDSIAPLPVAITYSGTLTYKINQNSDGKSLRLRIRTSAGQQFIINTNPQAVPLTVGTQITVSFSFTITLQPGEKVFMLGTLFGLNPSAQGFKIEFLPNSTVSVGYKSRYKTTYVKGLKASTVYRRLIKAITGSDSNCNDIFLKTYDNLILTSGNAVRGLQKSVLKTKLSDFHTFCRVQMAAGWGIEGGEATVQPYAYFLKTTNAIALGKASELTITKANDLRCNTVKIGYPVQKIDDLNGKYEFNNTHLYTSKLTDVSKELTLVCPYLAQPYYIETKRANLDGKDTTDSDIDNEILVLDTEITTLTAAMQFINFTTGGIFVPGGASLLPMLMPGATFQIVGSGSNDGSYTVATSGANATDLMIWVTQPVSAGNATAAIILPAAILKRRAYNNISGLPDSVGIFNLELSPKRLLLKQKEWLAAIFPGTLYFSTTDQNADLKTEDSTGAIIEEKADYAVSGQPLFLPWYIEAEVQTPISLADALDVDQNNPFTVDWFDSTLKGFLMKAAFSPDNLKPQQFKLLLSPDTNINDLIR